ncbi:MAG: uroporphyrinogen decarboxylase family protein [Candidatus Ratteibacteria bacterium]
MTPREIVKRAILFKGPERIPYDLPQPYGSDFLYVGTDPEPDWKPPIQTETRWMDEFGCIWEKLPGDLTMGQVKFHPLSDYSDWSKVRFPDYEKKVRYESARKKIENNKEEKFVLASIPFSLIHRLEYLRGHEAAWTDPYFYPEKLDKLLDKLCEIAIISIERFSEIGVDGIISCDDWGLQNRLMVRPEIWYKVWKVKYEKVYRFAKDKGILTFLHSCGYIVDILDGLIDANLNVIQMDQQENMGVEYLSERFGGRICFWCPVDIQNTMVKGTIEDVKNYAKKLIDYFGKFNGGFIGKWYGSPKAVGHSEEKIKAMAEVFIEYGGRFYKK